MLTELVLCACVWQNLGVQIDQYSFPALLLFVLYALLFIAALLVFLISPKFDPEATQFGSARAPRLCLLVLTHV